MENAITAALSKQIVLARALDITANNIANQTTTGFKAERVNFSEYVSQVVNNETGDTDISLVYDAASYTDFSAGGVQATHAPLDFAIDGAGFFAVQTDAGLRFTRDGQFSVNDFGEIIDRNGGQVLDDTNSLIVIDPERGEIVVSAEGDIQQDGVVIATIGVFDFENTNGLRRDGFNYFRSDEDPLPADGTKLRQGFIEIANVSPIQSMTAMIEIMRAYESAAQVIETSSQLARDAVQTLTEA